MANKEIKCAVYETCVNYGLKCKFCKRNIYAELDDLYIPIEDDSGYTKRIV